MRRLDPGQALLLVVDVQDRLVPHLAGRDAFLARLALLVKAAPLLGIPILATEQYPKGLGPTVPAIRSLLPADPPPMEKISFSCVGSADLRRALVALGRRQVLVAGIEAHVCIQQTVRDLIERGYAVFLAGDAVASRREEDRRLALERMLSWGAEVSTVESLVFEALGAAGTATFKGISALVKEADGR